MNNEQWNCFLRYHKEQKLDLIYTYSAAKLTQIMEFIKRWSNKLFQCLSDSKTKKNKKHSAKPLILVKFAVCNEFSL